MSEMKTIRFPGDKEPREIVDAKAREDIGKKARLVNIPFVFYPDETGTRASTDYTYEEIIREAFTDHTIVQALVDLSGIVGETAFYSLCMVSRNAEYVEFSGLAEFGDNIAFISIMVLADNTVHVTAVDGLIPTIGEDGNWVVGGQNTGKPSRGIPGKSGKDGSDGSNGKDGNGIKSAVLNADYTLTLTFDNGTSYTTPSIRGATGAAGSDGQPGQNGSDGVGIASIAQTTTSTADGGDNVFTVTLTNGNKATFTVKNGSKGSAGADGKNGTDGKTPVKGTDYYTSADKTEMVNLVLAALPTWTGGSY